MLAVKACKVDELLITSESLFFIFCRVDKLRITSDFVLFSSVSQIGFEIYSCMPCSALHAAVAVGESSAREKACNAVIAAVASWDKIV